MSKSSLPSYQVLQEWSIMKLMGWLRNNGFEDCVSGLEQNNIDGVKFAQLTETSLLKMGTSVPIKQRKKLIKLVEEVNSAPSKGIRQFFKRPSSVQSRGPLTVQKPSETDEDDDDWEDDDPEDDYENDIEEIVQQTGINPRRPPPPPPQEDEPPDVPPIPSESTPKGGFRRPPPPPPGETPPPVPAPYNPHNTGSAKNDSDDEDPDDYLEPDPSALPSKDQRRGSELGPAYPDIPQINQRKGSGPLPPPPRRVVPPPPVTNGTGTTGSSVNHSDSVKSAGHPVPKKPQPDRKLPEIPGRRPGGTHHDNTPPPLPPNHPRMQQDDVYEEPQESDETYDVPEELSDAIADETYEIPSEQSSGDSVSSLKMQSRPLPDIPNKPQPNKTDGASKPVPLSKPKMIPKSDKKIVNRPSCPDKPTGNKFLKDTQKIQPAIDLSQLKNHPLERKRDKRSASPERPTSKSESVEEDTNTTASVSVKERMKAFSQPKESRPSNDIKNEEKNSPVNNNSAPKSYLYPDNPKPTPTKPDLQNFQKPLPPKQQLKPVIPKHSTEAREQSPVHKAVQPKVDMTSRKLPPVPLELEGLYSYGWYHGRVERNACQDKLRKLNQDGCFVVRKSERGGQDQLYTMQVWYSGKDYNIPIKRLPNQQYRLGKGENKEQKTFSTVEDLVEFHRKSGVLLAGTGKMCPLTTHLPK